MTSFEPARIFVIEDDQKIAQVLLDYLQVHAFQATHCSDGLRALEMVHHQQFDLILLDRMLPGMDGVTLCHAIRQVSQVPIIMLTAMIQEDDKLEGLEAGADDYVCKPFSPREVIARVKAQLRRNAINAALSEVGDGVFEVNVSKMSIKVSGLLLALTAVEFRLLAELIKHPGRVFTRQQLLNVVSEDYRESSDRSIDVHIKNIRKKIAVVSNYSECVQSVYGVGYRFELD